MRAADLEGCFCLSSPDHFSSLAVLAGRDCKGAEHTGDMLCFERGYPRLSQGPQVLCSSEALAKYLISYVYPKFAPDGNAVF